jgi:hypothetical protein
MKELVAAREKASDAFQSAKQFIALHEPDVGRDEATLAQLTDQSGADTISKALTAAQSTHKGCGAARDSAQSAHDHAKVLRDDALKLVHFYRHKRDPKGTTAAKVHEVTKGSSSTPLTIDHNGTTFSLISAGARLYGRLDPAALAAYPAAQPLFQTALANGLIASFGTGDTGVKKRGADAYELKVRRTNLTANELPTALRVENINRPALVGNSKAITFDRAFTAH